LENQGLGRKREKTELSSLRNPQIVYLSYVRGNQARRNNNDQTTMKKFYAINYTNGIAISAQTGKRYGVYHSFPSAAARDEWVNQGADFRTDRGFRQAVLSSDSELRAEIRLASDSLRSHEANLIHH
jgi:hypothetical protein